MKHMLLVVIVFIVGCGPSHEVGRDDGSREASTPLSSSDSATKFSRKSKPPAMKLIPIENDACTFEEHSPDDRPDGLAQSNFDSNIIFYHKPREMGWDHSNGYTREAYIKKGATIIASRDGMPDLWIRSHSDNTILYSGPDVLQCVDYSSISQSHKPEIRSSARILTPTPSLLTDEGRYNEG